MIIRILKTLFMLVLGVMSLPLVVPVSRAFYGQLKNISVLSSGNQIYFVWGIIAYVILHLFFFKPSYVYNLGHEIVHVLTTWLSLGKAKNMKVSEQGGSVQTTKSNAFVSISPYFVPFYTLLVCGAYFAVSRFRDISGYAPYFIFFIGFTFAMHIIMTVEALKGGQPDLIKTGYLFSLAWIYVINVVIAGFIIGLIFSGFSFADMCVQFSDEAKALYISLSQQLFIV